MSNDAEGLDQFKSVESPAPTDCRVGPTNANHRSGYGSITDRTARVLDWVTRHPDATLASGEAILLVNRIRELEELLAAKENL